jgi:hypothetical protein
MKAKAPTAPINPLCRADDASDVVYMARKVVALLRNVQLMDDTTSELSRADSKEGAFHVLSMVSDALEHAQRMIEHDQQERRGVAAQVQS